MPLNFRIELSQIRYVNLIMSETTKEQCHTYLQTIFYVFIVRNAKIQN